MLFRVLIFHKRDVMIKKRSCTFQSIILLWIVLSGIVTVHPECRELLLNSSHQESNLLSTDSTALLSSSNQDLNSFGDRNKRGTCQTRTCCRKKQCNKQNQLLFSGQGPEVSQQNWFSSDGIPYPYEKEKEQLNTGLERRPSTISLFILTQSFRC